MPYTSASSIVFIWGGQIFLTMLKCTNLFYLLQSANSKLADGLGMRFFYLKRIKGFQKWEHKVVAKFMREWFDLYWATKRSGMSLSDVIM